MWEAHTGETQDEIHLPRRGRSGVAKFQDAGQEQGRDGRHERDGAVAEAGYLTTDDGLTSGGRWQRWRPPGINRPGTAFQYAGWRGASHAQTRTVQNSLQGRVPTLADDSWRMDGELALAEKKKRVVKQ